MVNKVKKLTLLEEWIAAAANYDLPVVGLALDSRKVKLREVFFACLGHKLDGRQYISEAIANGATAILCQATDGNEKVVTQFSEALSCEIPIFYVANLPKIIGLVAAKFYDYPSSHMTMIGITGTNGKTSCSHFIARLLQMFGQKSGVIGTLGAGLVDNLTLFGNTTPDPITLQQQLAVMYKQGVKSVAMEVSSQALVQSRLQGTNFNIAIFTNLTRDHLDYHKDMQDYANAKKMLFKNKGLQHVVINLDDIFSSELLKIIDPSVQVYYYSTKCNVKDKDNSITACNIRTNYSEIRADVITPWGKGELVSGLLGRFNINNLLVAITVLGIMGFPLSEILTKIRKLACVSGRMQALGGNRGRPLVVIDYAHTPDALEKALTALREHCRGQLWCVFGCGGDKDRGKRSLMGKIAERYSDHVIITNDNPRTENPEEIVRDITQDLLCPWGIEVEYDRYAAIAHALECAQANDIVLVAGKGHEDYQIVGTTKLPFNDIEVVKRLLYSLYANEKQGF